VIEVIIEHYHVNATHDVLLDGYVEFFGTSEIPLEYESFDWVSGESFPIADELYENATHPHWDNYWKILETSKINYTPEDEKINLNFVFSRPITARFGTYGDKLGMTFFKAYENGDFETVTGVYPFSKEGIDAVTAEEVEEVEETSGTG